jgi:hypothetical protein
LFAVAVCIIVNTIKKNHLKFISMNLKSIVAIAVFSTAAYTSHAQTTTIARPVSTIKNDRQRIKQGVKSGELTPAETARLAAQTKKLKEEKKDYKADGVITTEERKDLRQDKRKVSRHIYRQKHDGQTRP